MGTDYNRIYGQMITFSVTLQCLISFSIAKTLFERQIKFWPSSCHIRKRVRGDA